MPVNTYWPPQWKCVEWTQACGACRPQPRPLVPGLPRGQHTAKMQPVPWGLLLGVMDPGHPQAWHTQGAWWAGLS